VLPFTPARTPGGTLPRPASLGPLLVLLWAAVLGGCGETTTIPPPAPPTSHFQGIDGNRVLWRSSEATRGTVRYGSVSGEYDFLAYQQVATGDGYDRQHAVPLLSVSVGVPVYIQRVDRTRSGELFAAAEETVVFASLPREAGRLRMTSVDVQFGDAHVLQLPTDSKVVVIDAGNPYESRTGEDAPVHFRSWLDRQGITRLDVAVVTHIHVDHYGGFLWGANGAGDGLLEIFPVDLFLDVAEVSGNQERHVDLQNLLDDLQIPRPVIEPGMTETSHPELLGWDPAVAVTVLNAGSQEEWQDISYEGTRLNNDSVVLKISYGQVDIVTGGDCEVEGEARILALYPQALAGVEYYKVHHHGRYDASSVEWVTTLTPWVALVPVAFAAYDEGPDGGASATAQTLQRLADVGADVFRFDSAEPLGYPENHYTFWHTTFVTDGQSYEIQVEPSVWGPPPGGSPAGQPGRQGVGS